MERNRKRILSSPGFMALLFMCVCFALIYCTYGVYYLSNDDTGIMKTLSGYSGGTPTAYHMYMSYTMGMFYKILYTAIPTWNWYSYGSILLVIVANAAIIYSIYQQRELPENTYRYVDLLLIGLLTVAISLHGISRISWTVNALFAATAGTMLLLNLQNTEKRKWLQYVVIILFFIVSSLTRGASYKAVLPFAILVLLYHAGCRLRTEGVRKFGKICIEFLLLAICLLAIPAYSQVDVALKSDVYTLGPNTFEYYRGLYTDSPHIPYEGNKEFYESLGWDQELYNATGNFMFIDPRFNTENLKQIAEKSAEL